MPLLLLIYTMPRNLRTKNTITATTIK